MSHWTNVFAGHRVRHFRQMATSEHRKYTSREELPLHRLEWWGCRMDSRDLGRNVGQLLENEERDENA